MVAFPNAIDSGPDEMVELSVRAPQASTPLVDIMPAHTVTVTEGYSLETMDQQSDEPVPVGIRLTADETGVRGIEVIAAIGECFGTHIVWFAEERLHVSVLGDVDTGAASLRFQSVSDAGLGRFVHEKRGYEIATNTWWRYPEEANPASYREHCLRIVRKA